MKILILDDDISFAKEIHNDLSNHFSGLTDKTEFTVVTNGFSSFQLSEKYDICFLDIDLKDYNGIDIAKHIKQAGLCTVIIFISAHQHLVHDSLIVHPYFFIRKNFYDKDLNILFELIDDLFVNKKLITLNWKKTKTVVSLDNIIYLEASNHVTLIHTINGDFYDTRSLKDFLNDLNYSYFSQIHKAFAINMEYLLSYSSNSILLVGNIDLTIGRAYKTEFNKQYQEYLIK